MGYRLGIDIGGTFTDFVLHDSKNNELEIYKVPTTPGDPSKGVLNGLTWLGKKKVGDEVKFAKQIEIIIHGTTVATNAILTGSGAKTALLTTKGFRDALEMRRGIREELYDNKYQPPNPLAPRYLRIGIEERTDYNGKIVIPVNRGDVLDALGKLNEERVESIAVCLMHTYANNENEMEVGKIARNLLPTKYITLSSELLPQIGFYDRVSTTVLNAYIGPLIRDYLARLIDGLKEVGFQGTLLIMQSNGGVLSVAEAANKAASCVLSGPAAALVAGKAYAALAGKGECIIMDMGGTSTDISMVKGGEAVVTTEGEVNRYRLSLPILAIHTVGAGGGSIAWVDDGGLLRVGPFSVGSHPGPACYGLGGEEPTATDANLILGYLNKDNFLAGRMGLDLERALTVIRERIGRALGISEIEAAAGILNIMNINAAAGIREVSIKHGLDPRGFPLVVAGGAGPLHAGMIALELDMPLIIIPRETSVLAAVGMILSDLKYDLVRSYPTRLSELNKLRFQDLTGEMEVRGLNLMRKNMVREDRVHFIYSCDMKYAGQFHEVNVAVTKEEVNEVDLKSIEIKFHEAHDRLYGYSMESEPVELVNIRLTCIGETDKPLFCEKVHRGYDASLHLKAVRKVYLPRKKLLEDVPIYDGDKMGRGNKIVASAIIEQGSSTLVVPPEFNLMVDRFGSFVMYLRSKERELADAYPCW